MDVHQISAFAGAYDNLLLVIWLKNFSYTYEAPVALSVDITNYSDWFKKEWLDDGKKVDVIIKSPLLETDGVHLIYVVYRLDKNEGEYFLTLIKRTL